MRRRLLPFLAVPLAVALSCGLFFVQQKLGERAERQRLIQAQENVVVPEAQPKLPEKPAARRASRPPGDIQEVNWDVPFTSQAPLINWDAAHQEACEETSVLMVLRYFQEKPILSPDDAEQAIQALLRKTEELGFPIDLTAQQVAALLSSENKDRKLTISMVANPTEASIKKSLNQGMLVIVPAAGRKLNNPYFQTPGPIYHMLVIRGYTKDGFAITNDPGTKRGKEYPYPWTTLIDAIHDWNGGDVENGEKVAIVVGPFVPWGEGE